MEAPSSEAPATTMKDKEEDHDHSEDEEHHDDDIAYSLISMVSLQYVLMLLMNHLSFRMRTELGLDLTWT